MEALRKGEKVISIEAVTQSGKTGILNTASLAWHLYCYGTLNKVVPFNILPVKRSISKQSERAFLKIVEMFYGFEFVGGREGHTLADLYTDNEGNFVFDKYTKSLGSIAFARLCDDVEAVIEKGFHPIFFFDESDEAPHKRGFLGQVLDQFLGRASFVLLSATAYPFQIENVFVVTARTGPGYRGIFDEPGQSLVPIVSFDEVDKVLGMAEFADWDGLTKGYDKRKVRALIKLTKKGLKGLTEDEIAKLSANSAPGLFTGPFNGGDGCAIRFSNSKTDCDRFVADLEAEVSKGQLPKARVLKFYGSSLTQQTVMVNGRPVYLKYDTIEEMVEKAKAEGIERIIIVIAGSLRRGDCVPKNIRWFIDGTREMSTTTSIIQGFAGRATGYGSNSVLFVTQANLEEIEAHRLMYRLTGRKVGNVNPASHVRRVHASESNGITRTKLVSKTKAKQVYIRRETYEQEFPHVFAQIDRVIGAQLEWNDRLMWRNKGKENEESFVGKSPQLKGEKGGIQPSTFHCFGQKSGRVNVETGERAQKSVDFWKLFGGLLPEAFLSRVEQDQNIQIMRPGQTREEVKRNGDKIVKVLNDNGGGFTHISVGNYERQRDLGESRRGDTGDRALRDPSVRTADKDNAKLNIDMLFSQTGADSDEQKVMLITMPLCDNSVYAAHSPTGASGAIVGEVLLSVIGSASHAYLMTDRERSMMDEAAPARGGAQRKPRATKPRAKSKVVPLHERGKWDIPNTAEAAVGA